MTPLPAGACDAHSHVFASPFGGEPAETYVPPPSDVTARLARLDADGLAYGVIVQPAAYRTNPEVLLDAVARSDGRLTGVAAATAETSRAQLAALARGGVTGLRFTEVPAPDGSGRYPGTVPLAALWALAPAMRDLGLHAQLWSPLATVIAHREALARLGFPVVLDHMACIELGRGLDQPLFQALLAALSEDWLWIKLCLCRVSASPPDYDDARPFHEALVTHRPDRLLWGSDWPFVRMAAAPDPTELLTVFSRWTPEAAVRQQILVTNPARLYGFGGLG